MKTGTKISLILGCLFLFNSCIEDDNFSPIPKLEFEEFETFTSSTTIDSAKFVFSFQDGDGDIGSVDSLDFNCFLIYEEKNGDSITLFPEIENRKYSLPSLTPNAKDRNIEGIITLIIKPAPIYNILTDSAYRYSCYIIDRASNSSNTVNSNWVEK